MGEDIAQTDPDTSHVREAIAACELVVVQEIFLSQTAQLADVVLPAASFLEKDGTFVNFDRRFQRVRPALPPPGQARTDFAIVNSVAQALGVDLGCPTPADALNECAAVAPLFGGLSHHRLDGEGALHWPCRSADDPGEATLYLDRFATPDGRAALGTRPYLPPGEQPDEAYPFILITGRRLEHYNVGTMTRRTANLVLLPDNGSTFIRRTCSTGCRRRRRGRRHQPAWAGRSGCTGDENRIAGRGVPAGLSLPGCTGEPAHLRLDRRSDRMPRIQGDRGPSSVCPRLDG